MRSLFVGFTASKVNGEAGSEITSYGHMMSHLMTWMICVMIAVEQSGAVTE